MKNEIYKTFLSRCRIYSRKMNSFSYTNTHSVCHIHTLGLSFLLILSKSAASLSTNIDWFVGHCHFFGRCFAALLFLRIPHKHDEGENIDAKHYPGQVETVAVSVNRFKENLNFKPNHVMPQSNTERKTRTKIVL